MLSQVARLTLKQKLIHCEPIVRKHKDILYSLLGNTYNLDENLSLHTAKMLCGDGNSNIFVIGSIGPCARFCAWLSLTA